MARSRLRIEVIGRVEGSAESGYTLPRASLIAESLSDCEPGHRVPLQTHLEAPYDPNSIEIHYLDVSYGQGHNPAREDPLAQANATWRAQPASTAQRDLLQRWQRWAEGMSAGEASDMISARVAGFTQPARPARYCIYRGRVLSIDGAEGHGREEIGVQVKQVVIRQDKQFAKAKREIEAFEKLEATRGSAAARRRERIPESVRLFVWQRDEGKCVECGSREKLEFDHIIPFDEGGSSTERNIQLLCERHNRGKGKSI